MTDERTFYVLFEHSPDTELWHKYICRGWEHCWILQDCQGSSVSINMLTSFISVHNYDNPPEILVNEYIIGKLVHDIVKISLPFKSTRAYTVRGFLNCVTLVKGLLNIKKPFIFTPRQLHKHLLSIGGKSMKGL